MQTISIKKLLWLSFRKYKPGMLLETKSFFFFGNDKMANLSRKHNSIKCVYTYEQSCQILEAKIDTARRRNI